ncbi:MAG: hypothetical protein ACRD04_02595 [Terriglobales bacterium]
MRWGGFLADAVGKLDGVFGAALAEGAPAPGLLPEAKNPNPCSPGATGIHADLAEPA